MIVVNPSNNPAQDTAALKQAFANSPGQWVRINAGEYSILEPLSLPGFGRIEGECMGVLPNYGTIIRPADGFKGRWLVETLSCQNGGYADRILLKNILFYGKRPSDTDQVPWLDYGLKCRSGGELFRVEDCSFSHFERAARWYLGTACSVTELNVNAAYCRGYFIQLTGDENGYSGGHYDFNFVCGDDAGKAFLGAWGVHFVTFNGVRTEQPHASPGVSTFEDVFVDWRNDNPPEPGFAQTRDASATLNFHGGTANWIFGKPLVRMGPLPASQNGLAVRVNFRGVHFQGTDFWVDDRVNSNCYGKLTDLNNWTYEP